VISEVQYQPIPELPGYCAGSDGSVWSCWKSVGRQVGQSRGGGGWVNTGTPRRRLKEQTVKPTPRYPRNKPYRWVSLEGNGRKRIALVHVLVLEAFVGPCPEGMECRHLDGDVGNNAKSNLAWGTKQENAADKRKHNTAPIGEKNSRSAMTDAAAIEMRQLHSQGWSYKSLMARFSVTFGVVASTVQGRTRKHLLQGCSHGMERPAG
jgi:hypothetical protein